jgi:phosphohistidine swiveling domain-containing protein
MVMGRRIVIGGPEEAPDVRVLGGKAANLARLESANAPVPSWIALPAASPDDPLDPATLLPELEAALRQAGLDDRLLAVRSSAVGEDAAGASFAGQFETVLGVPAADPMAVMDAIRRVRASAKAERVTAYRGGGPPPRIAVILQALVDATASGVAFSADPVTGSRDTVVVSAVRGLGEALVSGEVDADTFRVAGGDDLRVVDREIAVQDRALRRTAAGTEWVELSAVESAEPAIADDEVLAIARAVRELADRLGGPQDVEWSLEGEGPGRRLVILQARPITALGGAAEVPDGELRVWDNSNIVESYAGVTTPLTFSFARAVYEDVYRQFCRVMGVEEPLIERSRDVFGGMIGLVRGRVYYNLLNWYRVLALLPGYAFNRDFMERMMGVREKLADPPDPPPAAGKWQDLGRLVRMVVRMTGASRDLRRSVPAFHERLDRALDPLIDEDLTGWSPDALLDLYRRLEDDLLRHWQPPLVNDFFAMIWFGVLGRLVERWLPDEPPTLVNDLLAGEGGMISTEPARRLMALAGRVADDPGLRRFLDERDDAAVIDDLGLTGPRADADPAVADLAASLRDYLRTFGDRCANELKLETVTLGEDPTFLVQTVRSYVRQGATDPGASRAREVEIRAAAEARVDGALRGVRRRAFRYVLRRARHRIRDRENLRFERTRVFGVVRRIFLGLGHALHRADRIDHTRDVFWLTTGELFGWVEGTAPSIDFRTLARMRKEEFDRYRDGPPPPERFETRGPPADAALTAPAPAPAPGDLAGTGCCPGVVRAPVHLVREPREAGDLDGRILVAERTDPGWTLLFPAAAGILVERGSLLSHSAIVAREMGIPCVVSVPGLMATLSDGEVVEMDGTTGAIRRRVDP